MKKILSVYVFYMGSVLLSLISFMPLKAQWQQVSNGIYGGTINSFCVCNGIVFAGVEGSGIYRFD
ncbi:MAG TPA: hypothetical protein P5531_08465, partial [Bacteroidales bacterium]|nr:hypothetical protein [Bacteroidales bacterium]HSA43560.1 hypothetical protein [Bacteroidales bacterium]